jgi:CDP-alcohol phosphatidyltransferase
MVALGGKAAPCILPPVSEPKRYTLDDVRRSYTRDKAWQELTGELPAYLFYRPVSFVVSYAALRVGLPVLAVTWLALGVACAILLAAVSGIESAYLWVAGLGIAYHVLDCVDGNLARTTATSSRFGAVLDGFADSVALAAQLIGLGVLVEREAALGWSAYGVEAGLGATLLVLLNRKVRDHFTLLTGERPVLTDAPTERPSAR